MHIQVLIFSTKYNRLLFSKSRGLNGGMHNTSRKYINVFISEKKLMYDIRYCQSEYFYSIHMKIEKNNIYIHTTTNTQNLLPAYYAFSYHISIIGYSYTHQYTAPYKKERQSY